MQKQNFPFQDNLKTIEEKQGTEKHANDFKVDLSPSPPPKKNLILGSRKNLCEEQSPLVVTGVNAFA